MTSKQDKPMINGKEEADKLKQEAALRNKQVGGTHYNRHTIQPWDIIDEYNLCFYRGNALKYLLRRKGDQGKQDIQKAIHYLEKILDKEFKNEV